MNEHKLLDILINVHFKKFLQDEGSFIDKDAIRDILSQFSDPEVINTFFNFFWAATYDELLDVYDALDVFFYEHYSLSSWKIFNRSAFDTGQVLFLDRFRS